MKVIAPIIICMLCCAGLVAQDFVRLSDKDCIELSLDMIRKGIQQEDAEKVLLVSGMILRTSDKSELTAQQMQSELESIFANAHKSKRLIPCPDLPREDIPLSNSAFWDFDIVDPDISIEKNSAIVTCTLVFWHHKSPENALRVSERMIFISQASPDEPVNNDITRWSDDQKANKSKIPSNRQWELAGFDTLLTHLRKKANN